MPISTLQISNRQAVDSKVASPATAPSISDFAKHLRLAGHSLSLYEDKPSSIATGYWITTSLFTETLMATCLSGVRSGRPGIALKHDFAQSGMCKG